MVAQEPQGQSQNSYDLTKRAKQILCLLFEGIGNKEIAGQLSKNIRTTKTHRFNIMKKLEVNNVGRTDKEN
ncbi:MAG: LuxR C-terminal-related transcriptional regulator [Bacteroidota bacterium]